MPVDSLGATGWNLFGHKGARNLVDQTVMHLTGVLNLFRINENILLSVANINSNWQ